eukprot:TRINITY_DN4885_c0_g1_i2.p1 TRINITY_DN4885_c0_g1~~TRINITY_DN4885_c0_g1_i2.p1  ORF type:complete len:175 (-),score=53.31 TRINITY_DN4885_c0_g1_i2:93-617(-)
MFETQTLALNQMRKEAETDHSKKHFAVERAVKQANLEQMREKIDRERAEREKEQELRNKHIMTVLNSDFYRENPATCQSALAPHRVLPYHFKGMNTDQRSEILNQQEIQRRQTEMIKSSQKEEERLFALQDEQNRKMLIMMEREKVRRQQELLQSQREYNKLMTEEVKTRKTLR